MGLKEFLVSVRQNLAELPTRKKLHIVIGNESCDLDSAVSAIVYAYFLHQIKTRPGTNYVPILNVARQNFRLRLETVYFLGKHGIHEQDLTFVSDLDLNSLTPKPGSDLTLAVTLVDHHVLSDGEQCLEPYVVKIFDHRPQDGRLPPDWDVTLEHVGSCCSLIARELLASETFQLDARVAELLLGTILADTGNMSTSDRIGTPGDHEQLVKLKAFLPPSISATSIYEGIQRAKFDLSSLTVREMLEKDMKIVKGTQITVAMSSVTKDLEEILCDPDVVRHARQFCEDISADVVIVMTVVMGDVGIRRRCIAVYAPNRVYRDQLTDVITASTQPNLDLQPITSVPAVVKGEISAFVQNNMVISRKGILPLVRNFLTGEVTSVSSSHDFFLSNISDNAAATDRAEPTEPSEVGNEEIRRHINLAKAHQCEQFRTSQDRYDLAALGSEALISPSLSSDSDLGNIAAATGSEFSLSHPDLPIADSLLAGQSGAGSGEAGTSGDNLLIDISDGGDNQGNSDNHLLDLVSKENKSIHASSRREMEEAHSVSATPPIVINCHEPFQLMCPANISDTLMTDFFSSSLPASGPGSKVPSYPETPPNSYMGSSFSLNRETQLPSFNSSEMVKRIQQKKAALTGHADLRRGNYEDDDSDGLAIGGSGGGGSLVSPAVPQNSYIDSGSGFNFLSMSDPDSDIPRLSSSDALMERVNEKRSQFEWSVESRDENDDINEAVGASGAVGIKMLSGNSSGCGSLDPPVPYTPQNSYVEGGFDSFSRSNLPSLNSAEMVARIRAKQSAMFGSNGSVGSSSRVSRSSHGSDDSGGCRSPDVMMVSGSDMGGRSLSSKASRGTSLDSPQQPYTPQNSYRDSMGLLEYRNRLPDLNEVAERLSTEQDAEKSKRSDSTSDDNREEDEVNELDAHNNEGNNPRSNMAADGLNNLQPLAMSGVALLNSSHLHHQQTGSPRKSSSRSHSDSQNTMSDVDSLMSVSTDIGTPLSDNVVATGLASQILRGEMALNGRKDTTDSDVFAPPKTGDEEETLAAQDDKRKHLKFSLTQENKQIIPNGPVAEEDLIGFNTHTHTHSISREDLFSPVEHSRDDLGFVNIAENIVAESIAAALNMSGSGHSPSSASQLRWMDQISSEISVSPENVVAANLSASILHEGSDRWQSDHDPEQEKIGVRLTSPASSSQHQAGNVSTGHNTNHRTTNNHTYTNGEHGDRGNPQEPSEDLAGTSEQTLSDAALNELAYEIAHELIQNVLENFPEISGQLDLQEGGDNPGAASPGEGGSSVGPARRVGVVDNSMMGELGDSVNVSSPSEPRKFSTDSNSSVSTSCSDRKWSRDTDSAMTIREDEIVTSFPERPEQEEEIVSFPGRKFSKSEDFPARRFSREDNASRRSSKIQDHPADQYEDMKVAPDGLETDYLPNMDPLQGNLDIIDSNFTSITDTDREVVEGESFRKVSGQDFGLANKFDATEKGDEEEELSPSPEGIQPVSSIYSGSSVVVERGIMKKDVCTDSVFDETGQQVLPPRAKKKIRVSFSEDVEDEAGDFNSSCSPSTSAHSPRSTLKSPPPFALPDLESQVDCGNSSAAPRPAPGEEHAREIYYTTAGRISIASGGGEVGEAAERTGSSVSSTLSRLQERGVDDQVGTLSDPDLFGVTSDPSPPHCDDPATGSARESCVEPTVLSSLSFFQPPESLPSQCVHNPVTVTPDPRVCRDVPPACNMTSVTSMTSGDVKNLNLNDSRDTGPDNDGDVPREGEVRNPPSGMRQAQPVTSHPLSSVHSRNLSSASYGSVKGAVYSEEWQDDDLAGMAAQSGIEPLPEDGQRKKIRPDPNFARHIADNEEVDDEDDEDEDDDETLDNNSDIGDLEWENDTPIQTPSRPGIRPTLSHDQTDTRQDGEGREGVGSAATTQRWKRVSVSGFDFNIDMQVVEPYRNVLSHGGYYAEGLNAIIVFYGCHLPSRRRSDYSYIMNHLFHYVVHTLEELVADDYVIVYFHGSTPRHKMPGLGWLRRCYQSIDRRLKKNLKGLFLVHPTLWLRTVVTMTRPFISSKFSSKLRFVRSLEELNSIVPMDNVTIPDAIAQLETILKSNPHFLEEEDEREKQEVKEEKAKSKLMEKERKRQEKERKKQEKLAAKEEKKNQKAAKKGKKGGHTEK